MTSFLMVRARDFLRPALSVQRRFVQILSDIPCSPPIVAGSRRFVQILFGVPRNLRLRSQTDTNDKPLPRMLRQLGSLC